MGPSELATGRAAQARALTATCTVGKLVRGPLDEATGKHPMIVQPVWVGPCSVKANNGAEVDSAGRLLVVGEYIVSIPVEGTEGVVPGLTVEVTAAQHDPALVGLRVVIKRPSKGSAITLRRFVAEEE